MRYLLTILFLCLIVWLLCGCTTISAKDPASGLELSIAKSPLIDTKCWRVSRVSLQPYPADVDVHQRWGMYAEIERPL